VRWTSCHLSSVATYLVLPHLTVEGKSVFDVASPLGLVTTEFLGQVGVVPLDHLVAVSGGLTGPEASVRRAGSLLLRLWRRAVRMAQPSLPRVCE